MFTGIQVEQLHFQYIVNGTVQVSDKNEYLKVYGNYVDNEILDISGRGAKRHVTHFIIICVAVVKPRLHMHRLKSKDFNELKTLFAVLILEGVIQKAADMMCLSKWKSTATPFFNSVKSESVTGNSEGRRLLKI
jgi:hypothetical protein